MNKNLFNEISKKKHKIFLYNDRSINFDNLKILINQRAKKISRFKKGLVSISTQDKIDFIINFYACNKVNFPVFLNDNNSIKKILNEKININYVFKRNNFVKINKKLSNDYFYDLIIKSSGSSSIARYVYLKNKNISHISKEMNKQMFEKNKIYNELIFAPIYHAFGFGRLHALMVSKNDVTLTDFYSISNFYNLIIKNNMINGISIPSKILSVILKKNKNQNKDLLKKVKYFQVSTGFLDIFSRKKILNQNINLFLNYGMTEAMRSTFLNLKKNKKKIHTEGKPLSGVRIKIKKNHLKKYGEILIKGKNLACGYSDKNEWDKKFKKEYFYTGDIGYLDKDNFLVFKSRLGNKLTINGKTFYIEDIEKIIKEYFNIDKLKIIQNKNKIYLISEKKLEKKNLYKLLNKNKINITFDKIIFNKISLTETGKVKFSDIKKLINGKN